MHLLHLPSARVGAHVSLGVSKGRQAVDGSRPCEQLGIVTWQMETQFPPTGVVPEEPGRGVMAELLSRAENHAENPSTSRALWVLVNLYVTWDLFCSACLWEQSHVLICK